MKSTILFFAITSLITLLSISPAPKDSGDAVRRWADSLEFAYRHDPVAALSAAELERRLMSSEIQIKRIKESVPAYRKVSAWRLYPSGQIFFTSAQ